MSCHWLTTVVNTVQYSIYANDVSKTPEEPQQGVQFIHLFLHLFLSSVKFVTHRWLFPPTLSPKQVKTKQVDGNFA